MGINYSPGVQVQQWSNPPQNSFMDNLGYVVSGMLGAQEKKKEDLRTDLKTIFPSLITMGMLEPATKGTPGAMFYANQYWSPKSKVADIGDIHTGLVNQKLRYDLGLETPNDVYLRNMVLKDFMDFRYSKPDIYEDGRNKYLKDNPGKTESDYVTEQVELGMQDRKRQIQLAQNQNNMSVPQTTSSWLDPNAGLGQPSPWPGKPGWQIGMPSEIPGNAAPSAFGALSGNLPAQQFRGVSFDPYSANALSQVIGNMGETGQAAAERPLGQILQGGQRAAAQQPPIRKLKGRTEIPPNVYAQHTIDIDELLKRGHSSYEIAKMLEEKFGEDPHVYPKLKLQ